LLRVHLFCGLHRQISRYSSTEGLYDERVAQVAAGAAAEDREHQVDVLVHGESQGRPDRYAALHAQAYG
jgi:hypothetical protein